MQPFSGEQMEDFSSELFSSFFDDHLAERAQLGDRSSFLHMDIESSPGKRLSSIDHQPLCVCPLRDDAMHEYISAARLLVRNNVKCDD